MEEWLDIQAKQGPIEEALAQLNRMDFKGGSNGLKVMFTSVEDTNHPPPHQPMECGVLRNEVKTI